MRALLGKLLLAWPASGCRSGTKRSGMKLPLVAYGEFMTSTGATAGDNGATIGGLHAGPKTVGLRALTVIRLESTFRHCGKF
jgi:hypothetical protein